MILRQQILEQLVLTFLISDKTMANPSCKWKSMVKLVLAA
jgi:hypothetical protein